MMFLRRLKHEASILGRFGDLGIPYSSLWEISPSPMSLGTYSYFFLLCLPPPSCGTTQNIKQRSSYSEHLCLFLIQVTFCFPWDRCFPDILGKEVLQWYFSNSFKGYLTHSFINLTNIYWLSAHHVFISMLGIRHRRVPSWPVLFRPGDDVGNTPKIEQSELDYLYGNMGKLRSYWAMGKKRKNSFRKSFSLEAPCFQGRPV